MNTNNNITPEELELIDSYLARELSQEDQSSFEKRLKEDTAWQSKVDDVRFLSIGIQEVVLEEKMNEFHATLSTTSIKPKTIEINWYKTLAVAASFIVGVTTISWLIFFQQGSEEKLFASYYQPDPGLATLMGVSGNYEFDKAMIDYKIEDYPKAIEAWKKLLDTYPDNDTLNYFIGSAHLANEEAKKSLPYFDKVIAAKNSVFLQDALWYKGLALLSEGKKQEAIKHIEKTEHPEKDALLEEIKK